MKPEELASFHANLASRGRGAKDWANTFTEVEHLGNGKFAASIGIGHRVFRDKADGQWKKHKLSDDRSAKGCVTVQSAKCCVEVYPYYAKYFDVNHEEVRLYEERWVVQRLFKAPDEWRDVGAYNPVMAVEETENSVVVTVSYTTDYGALTVKYIQRDGAALKHDIAFKNPSGSTETFRVLQRWAGIVADKVNNEEVIAQRNVLKYDFNFEKGKESVIHENLSSFMPTLQDEAAAAKKMWIRHGECNRCGKCCGGCEHYFGEPIPRCAIYETRPEACREFPWGPDCIKNIPECSYSFESTGITVPFLTKLQPTILDTHPKGLKADFLYGNWTLAQGESLRIDPATVTLNNPTVDGYISWQVGINNYAKDTAGNTILMHYTTYSTEMYYRGYVEWDVTSIPDTAPITKVEYRYHGATNSAGTYIRAMASQPSVQAETQAGYKVIYDDVIDGTAFLSNNNVFPEIGTGKDVGGASGPAWTTTPVSDLQGKLAGNWYALGFYSPGDAGKYSCSMYSEEYASVNPAPTLYVEYSTPSAAGGLKMIPSLKGHMGYDLKTRGGKARRRIF